MFGDDKPCGDEGRDVVDEEIGCQSACGAETVGFGVVAAASFVNIQRAPDQVGVG